MPVEITRELIADRLGRVTYDRFLFYLKHGAFPLMFRNYTYRRVRHSPTPVCPVSSSICLALKLSRGK